MKYYILILFSFFLMFSCDDLEDLNTDTKNPTEVPAATLFTAAQFQFYYHMDQTNVNFNNFRLFAQHWTETTYLDEANYDLTGRNVPEQHWEELYRDVLIDLKEANSILATEEPITADAIAAKNNFAAAIEVTAVHAWSVLVETFGDVPYTQAFDIENELFSPAYDNQEVIYKNLLVRLDAAIANMDAGNAGPRGDALFGGNMAGWVSYANSLKLKMGMRIADADAALSQQMVESAVAAGIITSNADNATIAYEADQPNTNPVYVALVASGRQDFIPANTLVDRMIALNDPRMDFYFDPSSKVFSPIPGTTDSVVKYWGGTYGVSSAFAQHSHIAVALHDPEFPGVVMSYSEMEFLLAEGAERGYNVGGGDAASHYDAAVTASIMEWTGSDATAAAYLAQPSVAYSGAGTWKEKIGMQKWLALYNRGYEAWTEWRRLDAPSLDAPPEALSVLPVRYTYPIFEQTLNEANWKAASTAIGGDNVATKLFWDKN